jgi:AraC-like DNA-binding protein
VELIWDTADHPVSEQMAYWADVVCQAFTPLAPARTRAHLARSRISDGVFGWVRSARLASTNSAEIASCTQGITHGALEVRRAPSEEIFVNLQLAGSCRGEQDGLQCVVTPGTFALFDTTRPYTLDFEESDRGEPWRVLSFRVPREQLVRLLPAGSSFSARTLDGLTGPGAVAATMMQSLWQSHDELTAPSRLALDHACSQVLATALGAFELPEDDPGRAGRDEALRAAIARFVVERLPYGAVPAQDAAAHVGVSVRKLHQLFAATDATFGAFVREVRLGEVARALSDPSRALPPATNHNFSVYSVRRGRQPEGVRSCDPSPA